MLLGIIAVNLAGVKYFGEFEFGMSLVPHKHILSIDDSLR